jgi:porin
MITKSTFISAILTIMITIGGISAHAQDTTKTFVPILKYTADLVVNTHGGIKTGTVYQGYAEAGVEINPWKNGRFNFTLGSTHGGRPTATLVGDWQEMDNIESANHFFVLNAWYSHTIDKVTIKAGLQAGDDSFSVFDATDNLQNTAFGGNAVLMSSGDLPTMPSNGLGLIAQWQISNAVSWQTGFFGHAIDLGDDNDFNLKHKLNDNGYVIVTEAQLKPIQTLVLKAGAYYRTNNDNNGFYAACEKSFHLQGNRAVNTFITGGYAPKATDAAIASITGGCSLTSLFSKSGMDALSAGLATAHLDGHKWETAIELNYFYQLGKHFFVSPDLQWILNPMGNPEAKNALAGTLRLGFEL